MLISVATVFVIIAVVGAEANQTGEKGLNAIPVSGASKDNVSPDSKIQRVKAPLNVHPPHHQAANPKESESKIKFQIEVKPLDEENVESSEEIKTLKIKIEDDTGKKGKVWDISLKCLDCLCYLATGCRLQRGCESPWSKIGLGVGFEKGDCGPFHISFPFWADAHDVKVDIADASMQSKWRLCSLDLTCSTKTIQLYFQKYPHDCNGDGKVDCLDYAAIHTLGPFGCMENKKLEFWNQRRRKGLLECLARKEDGAYIKKMHELENEMKPLDAEVMTI